MALPLIKARIASEEAQVFVDLKGFTRRTARAKELVMAEFLKKEFYEPILEAAKNYYYPGWHEPGTCLEVMFNKKAYDSLPVELQQTVDAVAAETNMWSLCEFEAGNGAALQELISKHNVNLQRFPEDLLAKLRELAKETLKEEANKDAASRKVHEAYKKFKEQVGVWGSVSEKAYYNVIAEKYKRTV